ncbi:MAG: hydrogenase expression/formation protein [Rubrivivax sp.]|nr:hydrogenase expression/formation protein [Rubrivivax sp.]
MHAPYANKAFPIPLVAAVGPGSQPEEEGFDYLPMPKGMATYHPQVLPEPEVLAAQQGCVRALRETLAALRALHASGLAAAPTKVIDLGELTDDDRLLLNQVLGEGEVAAQVRTTFPVPQVAASANRVHVQESVFAGVWRVLHLGAEGQVLRDRIEVGAVPQPLLDAAAEDGIRAPAPHEAAQPSPALPEGVMNAPSLLAELEQQRRLWKPGDAPHVINLTLLPLTPADSEFLTEQVGEGRVVILSRGYGNCRITTTRLPRTWRVTYFNSTDINILDTLEVCRVPEVACASLEDLEDSAQRLAEVLDWVEAP